MNWPIEESGQADPIGQAQPAQANGGVWKQWPDPSPGQPNGWPLLDESGPSDPGPAQAQAVIDQWTLKARTQWRQTQPDQWRTQPALTQPRRAQPIVDEPSWTVGPARPAEDEPSSQRTSRKDPVANGYCGQTGLIIGPNDEGPDSDWQLARPSIVIDEEWRPVVIEGNWTDPVGSGLTVDSYWPGPVVSGPVLVLVTQLVIGDPMVNLLTQWEMTNDPSWWPSWLTQTQ